MQASSVWILGLRNLWRDLRAGELRLIIVAVLLAVAALSSVGFFADRLQAGLQRDARQLLGGDVVVVSDNLRRPVFAAGPAAGAADGGHGQLSDHGAGRQEQGGASRLVALKAWSPATRCARAASEQGRASRSGGACIPESGHVWVDAPLLEALGLKLGDSCCWATPAFRISHIIAIEPDRGAGFMSFAPRVMIASADLAATRLVQPASRITYRLAVASRSTPVGPENAAQRYLNWAQEQAKGLHGVRVESLESGRPEMRQTLDRAEKFLSLVALLSALLSAVAVALAARLLPTAISMPRPCCACWARASAALPGLCRGVRLHWAWPPAAGVLLGWAVHHVFVWLLAGLVESGLPAQPVARCSGVGMGLTLLLAFGLPPVLQLAQVPPLRVMRRDLGALKPASWLVLGVGDGFAAC
jgi:putative ABC transport system permease protein